MIAGNTITLANFSVETVRQEFPILRRTVHGGTPLVYLDNAATVQKPQRVIDAITNFYATSNANVHRGGHALGTEATALFEAARTDVASFIGAAPDGVVFTRGTTESINLVASALASKFGANLSGKSVVITEMEHHANIVPWQVFCEKTGASLRVIPIHNDGTLDMHSACEMVTENVVVVAAVHVSNTLGVTNPVAELCALAQSVGAVSVIDGAQAIVHYPIDVSAIGCDFYVFSGHKLYGPTGIGVLAARPGVLDELPPYQTGGAMIDTVTFERTTYGAPPLRFEAGTPNLDGAIGLAEAVRWLQAFSRDAIVEHEERITEELLSVLRDVPGVTILGPGRKHAGIASFVIDSMHAHDIGTLLDEQGVAVRTGHHCTMPLLRRMGLSSAVRASIALYTTSADIEAFAGALHSAIRILR